MAMVRMVGERVFSYKVLGGETSPEAKVSLSFSRRFTRIRNRIHKTHHKKKKC